MTEAKRSAAASRHPPAPADSTSDTALLSLARQVRSWADTLLTVAGHATDIGLTMAQARVKAPAKKAAIAKAGSLLRKWRESAGLTARELGDAVGLGDASLIEEAEGGLVTLPFDVVLRLAGVLGRHDPIPVAMALTRQYNPALWRALEAAGVGKLAIQGSRERELVNVYRASDVARTLDDERFARVLEFTRSAFDMAVDFAKRAAADEAAAARSSRRSRKRRAPARKAG
jgi:transcriptional regulator with XRE-family HTH domain